MRKTIIWIGLSIGSTAGSALPLLWDAPFLSASSIMLSAVGGIIGIWVGYKITSGFE